MGQARGRSSIGQVRIPLARFGNISDSGVSFLIMGTVPGLAHTCEVRAAVISGVTILVVYLPLTALNHALGLFAPRHLSTVALLLWCDLTVFAVTVVISALLLVIRHAYPSVTPSAAQHLRALFSDQALPDECSQRGPPARP